MQIDRKVKENKGDISQAHGQEGEADITRGQVHRQEGYKKEEESRQEHRKEG